MGHFYCSGCGAEVQFEGGSVPACQYCGAKRLSTHPPARKLVTTATPVEVKTVTESSEVTLALTENDRRFLRSIRVAAS